MRRHALTLLLTIAMSSVGCNSLGKKKADTFWRSSQDVATTAQVAEPYVAPIEPYQYAPAPVEYPADDVVSMPAGSFAAQDTRIHVVAAKDTLFSLARSYYSDQRRWKEIYAANASTIGGDPNRIFVGQRLRIP